MSEGEEGFVDLGFLFEEKEKWRLKSNYFPSKVGGKPSWLGLEPLPSSNSLTCKSCGQVCLFLLQVYSPISSNPTAFHRTIFVFICPDPSCCKQNKNENLIVLRSNLPKINKFYSARPPNYEIYDPSTLLYPIKNKLCCLCGCYGDKRCGGCLKVHYCSKDHQAKHWKKTHKFQCQSKKLEEKKLEKKREEEEEEEDEDGKKSEFLFKEFSLQISSEDYDVSYTESEEEEEEKEEKNKNIKEMKKINKKIKNIYEEKDLERVLRDSLEEDSIFQRFTRVTNHYPKQVIRYERGGNPLHFSKDSNHLWKNIPDCGNCGSSRIFEFQIMPYLLSELNLDKKEKSLDWGVILVFTCQKNCSSNFNSKDEDQNSCYLEEFCLKEDATVKN